MALKADRVGVAVDQVDHYGRLIPTDWLISKLRGLLDTETAEINARRLAREEWERIVIDHPVLPVEPGFNVETKETKESEEPEEPVEPEEPEESEEEEVEDGVDV